MEWQRVRWKFDKCIAVDKMGRGEGLALLWTNAVNVEVTSFSNKHIDVLVGESEDQRKWRFTGFYGKPDMRKRHESWDLLRRLKDCSMLSWLYIGDFNEIMRSEEKLGGAQRPIRQIENFREVVVDCGLNELKLNGKKFT